MTKMHKQKSVHLVCLAIKLCEKNISLINGCLDKMMKSSEGSKPLYMLFHTVPPVGSGGEKQKNHTVL